MNRSRILLIGFLMFALRHYVVQAQVSFIANGQNITSSNSWDIRLADINGDGNLDIYFDGQVWLNDGKGSFTRSDLSFGSWPYAAFADLNGDGFVDAVSRDSIYLNDGACHYVFGSRLTEDIKMYNCVLADIDMDGDIDIISGSENADRILLNDGKGKFADSGISLGAWCQASYALGDLNGDGFTDIYVAIPHTPYPTMVHAVNKIWLGDGKGNFIGKDHDIPGAASRCAVLADLDNDGDLDLFIANQNDSGNLLFFNDGKGNYTLSGQKLGINSFSARAVDVDSDGDLDLFVCYGKVPFGGGAPNMVWVNDGKGNFKDSGLRLGNSNSIKLETVDVNGDGKIDAVVANLKLDGSVTPPARVYSPIEIWLNNSR
jgi:hypothetical protein